MAKEHEDIRVVHTTGLNNCGGRCIIHVHMRNGKIENLTTDTQENAGNNVPLCACARGLNYARTYLEGNRLLYPMKWIGERGEGKFERISWDEALDTIAREWIRIRNTYGVGSRYNNYATGIAGSISGSGSIKRLLALDGGYLGRYNSYSSACITQATKLMYGTNTVGSTPDTWLDSKLIILWGHNPAETKFDAPTMYTLKQAKKKGIPIIVIDPRENDTVHTLDAEWIPLRPATDAALTDAMAYVIHTEGLSDSKFLDRCCIGFDKEHMPNDIDPSECVLSYLLGEKDGIPKTPEWSEEITGVPADTIRSLARRYASMKPAALIQGFGAQRHAYGEQSARGAILLACMTGNLGMSGGWAVGSGNAPTHTEPYLPCPPNMYGRSIPSYLWTEAVLRGHEMTEIDGVVGGEKLDSDIKMIFNLGGNCLINQHGDINRTAEILRDTNKCEFIVCSDLFMTASAKYADILLPGTSMFESENITMPWQYGNFLGYVSPCIPPLGECRFEYDWIADLAERLGLRDAFTEGRSVHSWLEYLYNETQKIEPELPDFDTFCQSGIHRYNPRTIIGLEKECADPIAHPFPTESGHIELFSRKVWYTKYHDYFPAIPRYIAPPEGPNDPLRERYPLQLIGWHTKRRCHSIHDQNEKLQALDPQRLWLHPQDAAARNIEDGDTVDVFNDRGRVRIRVFLTHRVIPGVCALSQGAWYKPDSSGIDLGGNINVLTSLRPTPYARGNGQHTNLVQVERY